MDIRLGHFESRAFQQPSLVSSKTQLQVGMTSWVRTITSPFRKACTFFNHQPASRDKKSQQGGHEQRITDLHGEVMACGYEDVQVMWSILDKSKPTICDVAH